MIVVAALLFSLMDASTKFLGGVLSVVIVLWTRYSIQTAVMATAVWRHRGSAGFRTRHPRFQLLRALALVLLSVLSFFSLRHLPLAEFTAIIMLSPVLVTAIASRMSRMPIGLLRWSLLLGGFAGTLVVIRPGGALFGPAAILPLLATGVATAYNLLSSRLAVLEDPHTTQFYTGAIGMTLMLPMVAMQAGELTAMFSTLNATVLMVLVAAGLLGTAGHLLLVMAFRRAHAAALMPFTYTQIAFAAALGWVLFRHVPDAWAWCGMALIAASSCGSAWLDTRRRLAPPTLGKEQ
jgi:drug/metabolite transporter (DMT)-like permease